MRLARSVVDVLCCDGRGVSIHVPVPADTVAGLHKPRRRRLASHRVNHSVDVQGDFVVAGLRALPLPLNPSIRAPRSVCRLEGRGFTVLSPGGNVGGP